MVGMEKEGKEILIWVTQKPLQVLSSEIIYSND